VAGTWEWGNEPSDSTKCGIFLTSCKPVSFSRRTLPHGVSIIIIIIIIIIIATTTTTTTTTTIIIIIIAAVIIAVNDTTKYLNLSISIGQLNIDFNIYVLHNWVH